MRLLMCAVFMIAAAGCSNSPTSPTASGAATGPLRWDVVAASCAPVVPPSPLPEVNSATVRLQEGERLTASWPYEINGRSVTLYGHFVRENGGWSLCNWDTADV